MTRIFAAALCLFGCLQACEGAELKKLVVKCIEKAEATPDDIFLEFIADGKTIEFGKDRQKGTSSANTMAMKNGDVLTIGADILAAVKFEKTLTIHIKDKDITRNEPIGTLKLAPGDISNTYVSKGKDVGSYEYHADYMTTK